MTWWDQYSRRENNRIFLAQKWCAYITIGRLHEYRWGVEDLLIQLFPNDIAKIVMNYACDHPDLIHYIQNITIVLSTKTVLFTVNTKCMSKNITITLADRMGCGNTLGPGIESWNFMFWGDLPQQCGNWKRFKQVAIDDWIKQMDQIKSDLYNRSTVTRCAILSNE